MIRKCLFPAAGYGTRFLPATKAMPKEMLPIVDKPLIQYGVEEALEAGMDQVCIVSGRGKRAIEDHFDISYELEHQISGTPKEHLLARTREVIDRATFTYTRQVEMRGLGDAILTGRNMIGDEPFGVLLADDLCLGSDPGVLAQMVSLYEEYHCPIIAIQEIPSDQTSSYGIVAGDGIRDGLIRVTEMVEKPTPAEAPSNLAIIGRYILTPDIFDIIATTKPGLGGEIQITDAIREQAKHRMVLAYKFKGERFDCGGLPGYVEATNYVYKNHLSNQL